MFEVLKSFTWNEISFAQGDFIKEVMPTLEKDGEVFGEPTYKVIHNWRYGNG